MVTYSFCCGETSFGFWWQAWWNSYNLFVMLRPARDLASWVELSAYLGFAREGRVPVRRTTQKGLEWSNWLKSFGPIHPPARYKARAGFIKGRLSISRGWAPVIQNWEYYFLNWKQLSAGGWWQQ
jgi:hypothetical protein